MIEIWTEWTWFNATSEKLDDQSWMILKKYCFSGLEALEIYQEVNIEEYQQALTPCTETLILKKLAPLIEQNHKIVKTGPPYTPPPQKS